VFRLAFILSLVLSTQAWAAGIHKWVDDKGITHYGDVEQPREGAGNRTATEAGSKAQEEEAAKKREAEKKEGERKRRDKALLETYSSEEEIDLARDRNLQSGKLMIDSAQPRIKSVQGRLDGLRKQADAVAKTKPVPADLTRDIKAAEAEIAQLQGNVAKYKQDMDAIRARFEEDKKRFRELRSGAAH
jgi:hypothetical protein